MRIRVCVAGATGWAGRAVASAILASSELHLVGAIARRQAGVDMGEALGRERVGLTIVSSLEEALATPIDVLVDYTGHVSVKLVFWLRWIKAFAWLLVRQGWRLLITRKSSAE